MSLDNVLTDEQISSDGNVCIYKILKDDDKCLNTYCEGYGANNCEKYLPQGIVYKCAIDDLELEGLK